MREGEGGMGSREVTVSQIWLSPKLRPYCNSIFLGCGENNTDGDDHDDDDGDGALDSILYSILSQLLLPFRYHLLQEASLNPQI